MVVLGGKELLLRPFGTASGYPLVLENPEYRIQCGEFNNPSFFVTFRSEALWRYGAQTLHDTFLAWAADAGLIALQSERVSRIDFTFDYEVAAPLFQVERVVSLAAKDATHREDGAVQTISFGTGDVRLRIYDKVAEIAQESGKIWFYDLWGVRTNVWRIEWQVRKPLLRRFEIQTFADFFAHQGDVARYLANEHDSLRVPGADTNRSRWAIDPLWVDLQQQIEDIEGQGPFRNIDDRAILRERMRRIAISVDGYLNRVAAIMCILEGRKNVPSLGETETRVAAEIRTIHDPYRWPLEAARKRDSMRLGGK